MPARHVVVICANLTSHLRALVQLALNLLDLHHDLAITLLYPSTVSLALKRDLASQPKSLIERVATRLETVIVDVGNAVGWLEALEIYRGRNERIIEDLLRGSKGTVPGLILADVSICSVVYLPPRLTVQLFVCEHTTNLAKRLHAELQLPRVKVFHANTSFAVGYHRLVGSSQRSFPGSSSRPDTIPHMKRARRDPKCGKDTINTCQWV